MKSHYLSNRIGRILAALFFLASIGFVSSTAVQAQSPYPQDRDRDYRRDQDRDRDYRRDQNRDRDYDRNRSQNDDWRNRRNGGYGNNGRYGNNGGYQMAFNQGYQDGVFTGQNDSARGQNYDPQRSHFYRNGHGDNGGYGNNGRYGDRYQDQQAYREGFLQGYNQGYQRYRGSRNRRNGNNGRWPFPW